MWSTLSRKRDKYHPFFNKSAVFYVKVKVQLYLHIVFLGSKEFLWNPFGNF